MWLFHHSVPPIGLLGAAGSCVEALGRTGQDGATPCSALAASPETKPHQKDKNRPKAMPDVCDGPCCMCPGIAKPWLQQLPRWVSWWLWAGRTGTRRWHRPPLLGLSTKGTEGREVSPCCPFPSPPSQLLAVLFVPDPDPVCQRLLPMVAVCGRTAPAGWHRPLQNRRCIFHLFLHTLQC